MNFFKKKKTTYETLFSLESSYFFTLINQKNQDPELICISLCVSVYVYIYVIIYMAMQTIIELCFLDKNAKLVSE